MRVASKRQQVRAAWIVAVVSALATVCAPVSATVVDFDDADVGWLAPMPDGYAGLYWYGFSVMNVPARNITPSGYVNGLVSGACIAYNGGARPVEVTGEPFVFIGAYLTAAWREGLNITVQGFLGTTLLYSRTVTVGTTGPTWFDSNYVGVDRLVFSAAGGIRNPDMPGDGAYFAMDNFTFDLLTDSMTTCTLTTDVTPSGGGSLSRSPDKAMYSPGDSVTLTAAPAEGYAFAGWTGDVSGSANPATIIMDSDKSVTATFQKMAVQIVGPVTAVVRKTNVSNPLLMESDPVELEARCDPPGGTYEWSISSGSKKAYIKGPFDDRFVDIVGTEPSDIPWDIVVSLDYVVGGSSCAATYPVTMQKPTSLEIIETSNDEFPGQILLPRYITTYWFRILDQFGAAIIGKAQVREVSLWMCEQPLWYFQYQILHGLHQPRVEIESTALDGIFSDDLIPPVTPPILLPWNWTQQRQQTIWVAGWVVDSRCQFYYGSFGQSLSTACPGCANISGVAYLATDRIEAGQHVFHTIPIDGGNTSEVTMGIDRAADTSDIVLHTPNGEMIDADTAQRSPEVVRSEGDSYVYYTVPDPLPGEWTLEVVGKEVPLGGEQYAAIATVLSNLTLSASTSDRSFDRDDAITVTAELGLEGSGLGNATVTAEIERPDGVVAHLALYDEGKQGDDVGGDGCYVGVFDDTSDPGLYMIRVRAEGVINNERFQRLAFAIAIVGDCPDLIVTASDIQFSDETPLAGQLVTISALAANIGSENADNAFVCLYDGGVGKGRLLAQDTVSLGAGQSTTIEVAWTIPPGEHEVCVALYPSAGYIDQDYSNNMASRHITAIPFDANNIEPTAHWRLDETSGPMAYDSVGENHGTVYGGAAWQPDGGQIGGALLLDGIDDYVDCGNAPGFSFTDAMTVAAWINVTAFDEWWQAIVTKGDRAWRLQRNEATDTLEFACTNVNVPGNSTGSLFGTKPITLQEWHHVAGVYDGASMYLYIDGALDVSRNAQGSIRISSQPVMIGNNSNATYRLWNGLIDDVRLYSQALTPSEIRELAQGELLLASNPRPADGAVVHVGDVASLRWSGADTAVGHDVYFGTDAARVADALIGCPEYMGRQFLSEFPFGAYTLSAGDYFWRVDEVAADGWTVQKGVVWKFTVRDVEPPEPLPQPPPGTSLAFTVFSRIVPLTAAPSAPGVDNTFTGCTVIEMEMNFELKLIATVTSMSPAGGTWTATFDPEVIGPSEGSTTLCLKGENLDLAALPASAGEVEAAHVKLEFVPAL
ncbi:MAG: hypothetical protein JW993_03025 [Sedimentisphaerales bacterium]|nr:hypothetical protein [Sedimentisphaerales bacterium]